MSELKITLKFQNVMKVETFKRDKRNFLQITEQDLDGTTRMYELEEDRIDYLIGKPDNPWSMA